MNIILTDDALNAFLDGSESEDRISDIRDCLIEVYEEMGFSVDYRRDVTGIHEEDDSGVSDWNRALDMVSERMGI